MTNVSFSGGPDKSTFSMYSTTNSIMLSHPHGQNKPIDPLKHRTRSGFFNNQGYKYENHISDEGKEKKSDFEDHPDFRSVYKSNFVRDGSIHGVLDEHDEMIETNDGQSSKASKTGYISNSDGFLGNGDISKFKGTSRETYTSHFYDMDHPEIKKIIEPGKHRKYPQCGYLHCEKEILHTQGKKLEDTTTYREKVSRISGTFFSDEIPRVPDKKQSPSFIKSEVPATEISRVEVENLKKFEEERYNKMHPTILRRMKTKDRITYDDIVEKRDQFSTISKVFYDEKDPMSQKEGRKYKTAFGNQVHTDTRLHREGDFDNKVYMKRAKRLYDGKGPRVERRFNSSGFQNSVSDGKYLKDEDFKSVSDTLVFDQKKLKTFHPTISKILKTRHPSTYGDAVPTYQHKRRNV